MTPGPDDALLRVLTMQVLRLRSGLEDARITAWGADRAIEAAKRILDRARERLPERPEPIISSPVSPPRVRSWDELNAEAETALPAQRSIADVLTPDEIEAVMARFAAWRQEFADLHRLYAFDYAVAGVAGVLAGLADSFLVPPHRGFMRGAGEPGGWLSNLIREKFGDLLPGERIAVLEKAYKVSFDPATNSGLGTSVLGLGPRSHRLHSLGHDPILGWLFGVRDILAGGFTAIGSDGRLVVQACPGFEPAEIGVGLFNSVLQALGGVAGHLLSDVATPAGLPPPFFALLQFLQCGNIRGRSIAGISRLMYRSGYDFRRFVAGSVCTAVVEIIVRAAWIVREISEGADLEDLLPLGHKPRLESGLFLAHCVAAAVNAGKVAVTNPFSINCAQWLTLFSYLVPQIHWGLIGSSTEFARIVETKLDQQWSRLEGEFADAWEITFGSRAPLTL